MCLMCDELTREITRMTAEIEQLQSDLEGIADDNTFDTFSGMKEKMQRTIQKKKNALETAKAHCILSKDTCGNCCVQQWSEAQQNVISTLSDQHQSILQFYKGKILAKNTNLDALFTLISTYPNSINEIISEYLRS